MMKNYTFFQHLQHLAPFCGWYASCVHAGGLSCYGVFPFVYEYKHDISSTKKVTVSYLSYTKLCVCCCFWPESGNQKLCFLMLKYVTHFWNRFKTGRQWELQLWSQRSDIQGSGQCYPHSDSKRYEITCINSWTKNTCQVLCILCNT